MGKKCGRLVYQAVLLITMILCFFIEAGTIKRVQDEVFAQVLSPSVRLLFPMLVAVLICLFLVLLYRMIDRLNNRQLAVVSVVLFCIMTLIFLIIFCNFRVVPYTDALNIQDTALYFARTGKEPLTLDSVHGGYFSRYANNYFLVVVLRCYFELCMILGIQDMYWPLIILSFAALMTAVLFMYLTGVMFGGMRRGAKILALCVMNPLYYLLVLWVYTNVLSIPFVMAGIYFGLCVYRAKTVRSRRIFCILTAAAAVVGYYVRATSLIPIIAVASCAFLWGLRDRKNMSLVFRCAVLCAITAVILFKAIAMVNDYHFSAVSDNRFPIGHFLMMASHGNGRHNSSDVVFTSQFETIEEKSKATLQKTIENYKNQTFTGLLSFLHDKLLEMWSCGDGGDLTTKVSQDNKMTKLYSWLIGSQSDLFRVYSYAFRIVTVFLMILAVWDLLGRREIDPVMFLIVLSFFGAVLFYCIWEIKGCYGLPFVCIMLLIGEYGAETLVRAVPGIQGRMSGRGRQITGISLVCMLGVCVVTYNDIINSNVTIRDWSLNCNTETSMNNISPNEKELELTQEVYLSKPFDHIRLAGGADSAAVEAGDTSQLTILNGKGQVVYERTILAQELAGKGYPVIDTGKIVPEGREKFTICLTKSDQCQGKMYFRCRSNRYMDIYDGVLTVNGEEHKSDLFLQVYNEYEGAWCSVKTARILFGILILGILGLYCWAYVDSKCRQA